MPADSGTQQQQHEHAYDTCCLFPALKYICFDVCVVCPCMHVTYITTCYLTCARVSSGHLCLFSESGAGFKTSKMPPQMGVDSSIRMLA